MTYENNNFLTGLFGLAVADAVGVPYEFKSRTALSFAPAVDMVGYGTHYQPPGTWSDDTSMALCIAESLKNGFDPEQMMMNFIAWKKEAAFTATDELFDIGGTCAKAIHAYMCGAPIEKCGVRGRSGNGNGALMRTFPASLWAIQAMRNASLSDSDMLTFVHAAASLTHAHPLGLVACGVFTLFIDEWLKESSHLSPLEVLTRAYERAEAVYSEYGEPFIRELTDKDAFIRPNRLITMTENDVSSGGYVLDTLNAAFRCLLTTVNYRACVLKAVNLGEDTDTTAAVAGCLASLVYGFESIPESWLNTLKKPGLIRDIAGIANSAALSVSSASAPALRQLANHLRESNRWS